MPDVPTVSDVSEATPVMFAHKAFDVALIGCATPLFDPKTINGRWVCTRTPVTMPIATSATTARPRLLAQDFKRIAAIGLNRNGKSADTIDTKEKAWPLRFCTIANHEPTQQARDNCDENPFTKRHGVVPLAPLAGKNPTDVPPMYFL